MEGVDDLHLTDAEYTLRSVGTDLSDAIDVATAGLNQEAEKQHAYNIVSSDGTRVLGVKWGVHVTKEGEGLVQSGSMHRWYAFETPGSERLFTVEYDDDGWLSTVDYTIRDASTESVLGTWARTSLTRKSWKGTTWELEDPAGQTTAIASEQTGGILETLGLSSSPELYSVATPGDREVASVRKSGAGVEITLAESLISGEFVLAFAVALLRDDKASTSSSSGGE